MWSTTNKLWPNRYSLYRRLQASNLSLPYMCVCVCVCVCVCMCVCVLYKVVLVWQTRGGTPLHSVLRAATTVKIKVNLKYPP